MACRHADMVRRRQRDPGDRVILSGGELTVTVSGEGGMGGPNREYALALALALGGRAESQPLQRIPMAWMAQARRQAP